MFRQILYTQWKWTRTVLGIFTVLAFILPAAVWRLVASSGWDGYSAVSLLVGFSAVGPLVATLGCLAALALAFSPWIADAAAMHVYPLSLPVTWPRYVAMRYAVGALSLLLPTVALWLGCLLALSLVELPPTLHAYPVTLAVRFLIASLMAYTIGFALQYLAGRRSAIVLLGSLVFLSVASLVLSATGYTAILDGIGRFLVDWPGPLAVFAADWSLVDV